MPEGDSNTRIQIVVAVIGVIGVLGTAAISNVDKFFPKPTIVEPVEPRPRAATSVAASAGEPPRSEHPFKDQFVGSWRNENPQTDGVTRLDISDRLGGFSAHFWGKCHPTDCDNGTHPISLVGPRRSSAGFSFEVNTITERGLLTLLDDGKLEMVAHTHFNDTSNRPDYEATYRFIR